MKFWQRMVAFKYKQVYSDHPKIQEIVAYSETTLNEKLAAIWDVICEENLLHVTYRTVQHDFHNLKKGDIIELPCEPKTTEIMFSASILFVSDITGVRLSDEETFQFLRHNLLLNV